MSFIAQPYTLSEHLINEINKIDIILKSKKTSFLEHKDNLLCRSCLFTFKNFKNFTLKKYGLFILEDIIILICSHYQDAKICNGAVHNYSHEVINSLIDHYFNEEYICSFKLICQNNHFEYLEADDFAFEIIKNKKNFQSSTTEIIK